jgi:hypothetical protein
VQFGSIIAACGPYAWLALFLVFSCFLMAALSRPPSPSGPSRRQPSRAHPRSSAGEPCADVLPPRARPGTCPATVAARSSSIRLCSAICATRSSRRAAERGRMRLRRGTWCGRGYRSFRGSLVKRRVLLQDLLPGEERQPILSHPHERKDEDGAKGLAGG